MDTIQGLRAGVSRPLVMGIVNATPDSFYPNSRQPSASDAVQAGIRMVEEGADLLDVGGESTRPGSKPVPLEEELDRVVPVIDELSDTVQIPISVDTRRADVAREAIQAGASVVNDTSAGRDDPALLDVVADAGADVVLMHRQGEPATMQEDPTYEDVVQEVQGFLDARVEAAQQAGIERDRILVDPGIGFGKRLEHNLSLIANVDVFGDKEVGVLLGVSRKSMFGRLLGRGVEDRLPGSLAVAAWSVPRGVDVLRVHDVAQTVDVVATIQALREAA